MKTRITQTGDISRRGFSLTEMVLALALIAAAAVVAVPVYERLMPRMRIIMDGRELKKNLQQAHTDAITRKQDVAVTFYPLQNVYDINGVQYHLKTDVQANVANAPPHNTNDPVTFYFHPDGSATAGTFALFANNRQKNFSINASSGQIVESD